MKRIWFILIISLLVSAQAISAEDWKIKLEEAKVYLDQKEYDKAEQILQKLVKDQPEQWETNYYLGLVKLAQEKAGDAERSLRKASEIAPDNLFIRNALAFSLLKQNKLDNAKLELDTVLKKDPQNARAYYLRGICFIQKNDCKSAEPDLRRAKELDAGYSAEVDYYLGLCALNAGNTIKARKLFDQAVATGKGTIWAERAGSALARVPERKPFFISADIFYQYDSNIVPVAEEDALPEEISEMSDSRWVTWVMAGAKLLRDKGELGAEYHFYNNWQSEEDELNLQIHQGAVNGYYNFEVFKRPARVWAQYMYQYAGLGDDYDYYSTAHRGGPAFFFAETKSLVTELNYQYIAESFDEPGEDDFDRDNTAHQVMLGQHIFLWNDRIDLSVFGRYKAVNADGKNYDSNRYGGRIMGLLSNYKKLSCYAYFDYDYRDYFNSDFDRLDKVYSGSLEVEYQIIKYLSVFIGASYSDYVSNIENYDYDREIYSAGIRAKY